MQFKLSVFNNKKIKAAKPLIMRSAAFVLVCVIYSGLIGPRIISGGIIYKDHFGIYGGLGKSLLFALIAFFLLVRRKKIVKIEGWKNTNLVWLLFSIITFLYTWSIVSKLLEGKNSIESLVLCQLFLWLSLIFALLGIFGITNIRKIINAYKKQLIYAILLAIIFYVFLTLVYSLWGVLATIVLHSVKWLLNISGIYAEILYPRTLILSKFGIQVAQYCSGIESIALFTGLYMIVGVLDWDKLNHKKLQYIFPIALILLFGLNILRVYLLILAGYYINPHIAFSLFHTYAGMLFFIIYSAIFWLISYKWLLKDG